MGSDAGLSGPNQFVFQTRSKPFGSKEGAQRRGGCIAIGHWSLEPIKRCATGFAVVTCDTSLQRRATGACLVILLQPREERRLSWLRERFEEKSYRFTSICRLNSSPSSNRASRDHASWKRPRSVCKFHWSQTRAMLTIHPSATSWLLLWDPKPCSLPACHMRSP